MQRKGFIEQHSAGKSSTLVRIQLLIRQPGRLLYGREVIPEIRTECVHGLTRLQCRLRIRVRIQHSTEPRQRKMRKIAAHALDQAGIGLLQRHIGRAHGVRSCGPVRSAGAVFGRTIARFRGRRLLPGRFRIANCVKLDPQFRANRGDRENPVRLEHRLHHLCARARTVAGDRGEGGPIDTLGRKARLRLGGRVAQARLVTDPRRLPELIERPRVFRIEALDSAPRDFVVLRIVPCERRHRECPKSQDGERTLQDLRRPRRCADPPGLYHA